MKDSSQEDLEWSWEESLRTAIHCGISFLEYEEMTPYELSLVVEIYNEKLEVEQDEKILLVWLGEYYHRTTKLPPLRKAIDELKGKKKTKRMTDEEMLNTVKRLNTLFGGTIEEGAKNES